MRAVAVLALLLEFGLPRGPAKPVAVLARVLGGGAPAWQCVAVVAHGRAAPP